MEFVGKIIFKGTKEMVGQNGTEKLTVVLEEISDREYKSSIAVEFYKDKIGLIEQHNEGAVVKAYLNPRAREYNGRRYNSIACWKLEMVSGSDTAPAAGNDDLPF